MIRCKHHEKLSATIRDTVPAVPGVYLFKDEEGRVIYIGKSVNLRNRMLSYFRQNYDTVETRIGQMIHSIDAFDYYLTVTELQALLIEDELIKNELPEYNIRQKEFDECRYLLLTRDPYPALKMVENQPDKEKGIVFGPYKDRYFVSELIEIIRHYFHLRACTESVASRKCMNYEIGTCTGPCWNAISIEDYSVLTEQVVNFLKGSHALVIKEIHHEMKAAASREMYEKAAALRNQLDFCRRFCTRQHFINKFITGILVISEGSNKALKHLFDKGQWIRGQIQTEGEAQKPNYTSKSNNDIDNDIRFTIDRANIIYNWLRKNGSSCEHYFL